MEIKALDSYYNYYEIIDNKIRIDFWFITKNSYSNIKKLGNKYFGEHIKGYTEFLDMYLDKYINYFKSKNIPYHINKSRLDNNVRVYFDLEKYKDIVPDKYKKENINENKQIYTKQRLQELAGIKIDKR